MTSRHNAHMMVQNVTLILVVHPVFMFSTNLFYRQIEIPKAAFEVIPSFFDTTSDAPSGDGNSQS